MYLIFSDLSPQLNDDIEEGLGSQWGDLICGDELNKLIIASGETMGKGADLVARDLKRKREVINKLTLASRWSLYDLKLVFLFPLISQA